MVFVVPKEHHQGDYLQNEKEYEIEVPPDEQYYITHAKQIYEYLILNASQKDTCRNSVGQVPCLLLRFSADRRQHERAA